VLGMTELGIVPCEVGHAFGARLSAYPVGSGPYVLKSFDQNGIVAVKRKEHWRFSADRSASVPDGIAFLYFDDPFLAFRESRLDCVRIQAKRLHSYMDASLQIKKDLQSKGYQLYAEKLPATYYLMFNYSKPLLNNTDLRKAIAYAVPWGLLADTNDTVHASFIPQGIAGSEAYQQEHDITKAKVHLANAGFTEGRGLEELVIRFTDYEKSLLHAGMLEDALKAVGIPARIEYGTDIIAGAHLGFLGWHMDYPDADNILRHLYFQQNHPNSQNFGNCNNRPYNQLLESADNKSGKDVTAVYHAANKIIFEQTLAIPFRQETAYWAIAPRVEHMEFLFGYIDWIGITFKKS